MNQTIKAQASKYWVAATALALPMAAHAQESGAPIDMSSAGTTIAGYVALAAAAGLLVFVPKASIRVIVGVFKSLIGR